jgi:hypothetical protein
MPHQIESEDGKGTGVHLLPPHVALSQALPHLDVEKRYSGISRRKKRRSGRAAFEVNVRSWSSKSSA